MHNGSYDCTFEPVPKTGSAIYQNQNPNFYGFTKRMKRHRIKKSIVIFFFHHMMGFPKTTIRGSNLSCFTFADQTHPTSAIVLGALLVHHH